MKGSKKKNLENLHFGVVFEIFYYDLFILQHSSLTI
nr:MAG TPA: hypothetical protein [Caudoviricetes sp.]